MALNLSALGDLAGAVGLGGVTAELRSALTPGPLRLSAQQAADLTGAPAVLGPLLRPALRVYNSDGSTLYSVAPYGEPPSWTGYAVVIGAPLLLVALGFALGRL